MDKELSKAIMNKSKLRNRYLKWLFRENCLGHKTIENKCNNLLRKLTKKYFQENAGEGSTSNKLFWNTVKPFISNKGTFCQMITSLYKLKMIVL